LGEGLRFSENVGIIKLMVDIYVSPSKKAVGKKAVRPLRPAAVSKTNKAKKIRREVYSLLRRASAPATAFVARPRDILFETQIEKEEIILLLRRHPITNLSWILIAILMCLAPFLLRFFPFFEFMPPRFQFIGVLMWYLLVIAFVLEQFLGWYFNVYFITDERLVDVDFISLIYKEISDAAIDKIQDVSFKMGGILGMMFNYGTVYIQTAAERPKFEFEDVPDPALVSKVLEKLRMEEQQEVLEGRVR
jgi:hypothetical protein